jgi:pyrroline-5-carboxylate reductase
MRITFIGGGNMAGSLIGGLLAGGADPEDVTVSEPDAGRRAAVRDRFGVLVTADNRAAIEGAQAVVLAVKPQVAALVAGGLAPVSDEALYLSVIAGIRIADIRRWLGGQATIVRAMPNTPALLGCGISALFAEQTVDERSRDLAEKIMRAAGAVIWVDEEPLLDPVTALSGSGPAYFFLLMEAMSEAGVAQGLSVDDARLLTLETALGATRMAMESDCDLGELRSRVTSRGGTTAAALEVLQSAGVPEAVRRAIEAARDRAGELADEFGKD